MDDEWAAYAQQSQLHSLSDKSGVMLTACSSVRCAAQLSDSLTAVYPAHDPTKLLFGWMQELSASFNMLHLRCQAYYMGWWFQCGAGVFTVDVLLQVAGATGSLWAAEAAWAAASKQVEKQKMVVANANDALSAALDTPLAKLAHKGLHRAEERLQVGWQPL